MKKIRIAGLMVVGLLAMTSLSLLAAETPAPTQSNLNGTISNYKGTVEYAPAGSNDFKPVSQETPIPLGSQIRTGKDGQCTLVPFPGAAMTLSPDSVVDLSTMNITTENRQISKKTALMDLKQGMATIAIDHNAAQKVPVDFKLKTATSVASAVGTQYVVVVMNGTTYVQVLDGTVKFGKVGGPTTDVTSSSGIGVFGADGTVHLVPSNQLPPGVHTALSNAPVEETDGDATIGAIPGNGRNPRFPWQYQNPELSIQGVQQVVPVVSPSGAEEFTTPTPPPHHHHPWFFGPS